MPIVVLTGYTAMVIMGETDVSEWSLTLTMPDIRETGSCRPHKVAISPTLLRTRRPRHAGMADGDLILAICSGSFDRRTPTFSGSTIKTPTTLPESTIAAPTYSLENRSLNPGRRTCAK